MKYLLIILTLLSSSICFAHRDLETGTFLPRDPIGYSDGPGVYCYVNCNPICAVYEAYETRPIEWSDDSTGNPDRQIANTKDEEAELGLLNEGMRYRDLETGTFLTRDPIGYADGPNVYCYVHCNPITSFDPLGLNENRIEAFIPDLGIDLSYSTDPWFDSGEFALYDGTYLDALAAPIEAVIEGSAAAIGWTTESLWDGAVGWYDVACAMGNSIAWCGGEILSAPDTILDNVTETDMYGRMFAVQNTPIPYDDMIVGTLGMLNVSGTWLKSFSALDRVEDVIPATINPNQVRFSQSSIRSTFKNGDSVDDLAAGLKNGTLDPSDIPAIRLTEKDGELFTLDNRRLEAFRRAGVDVPYQMATPEEAANEAWKFTTENGGTSIRVRGE